VRFTFRHLLISLFLVLLGAPAAAHAASGMEIGVQDDDVLRNHYWGSEPYLYQQARRLGAKRIRVMVRWTDTLPSSQVHARTKPKKVTYNRWAVYDGLLARAQKAGYRVQLVLTGPAPAWANAAKRVDPTTAVSPNTQEYGKWVYWAVRHFRAKGIYRFSIWNEPNHVGYLRYRTKGYDLAQQARIYRGLYYWGSRYAKKASASAQLLFGEFAPYYKKGQSVGALTFLRAVLCIDSRYRWRNRACPRLSANGVATHPYDNYHPATKPRSGADNVTIGTSPLNRLAYALDRARTLGALSYRGKGKMPIFLTEFGYFGERRDHNTVTVPESKRPSWARLAFTTALKHPRVKQMIWYQIMEPARNRKGVPARSWLSYIIRLDGTGMHTLSALVAWYQTYKAKIAK
jgi:hypothetical protein